MSFRQSSYQNFTCIQGLQHRAIPFGPLHPNHRNLLFLHCPRSARVTCWSQILTLQIQEFCWCQSWFFKLSQKLWEDVQLTWYQLHWLRLISWSKARGGYRKKEAFQDFYWWKWNWEAFLWVQAHQTAFWFFQEWGLTSCCIQSQECWFWLRYERCTWVNFKKSFLSFEGQKRILEICKLIRVDSLLKVFLELWFEFFLSLSWPSGHDV